MLQSMTRFDMVLGVKIGSVIFLPNLSRILADRNSRCKRVKKPKFLLSLPHFCLRA